MLMKTNQITLSRLLPKTGQSVVYTAGDDGTNQAGWWQGLTLAANRERFVAKTISEFEHIVIDNATGLTWAADGNEGGCRSGGAASWASHLTYLATLDFAGFTDWRMPNIFELFSIIDMSAFNPAVNALFTNTKTSYYWSSTAESDFTTWAWRIYFILGNIDQNDKTASHYLRAVRGGL